MVGANTNNLNLDHLTFKKNGERVSFLHPWVGVDEFLSGMSANNYLSADVNYRIGSFGFYDKRDGFWNFDLGIRATADANVPKSLLEMSKIGLSDNENDVFEYNITNTKANVSAYLELGGGYSLPLLDNNLLVGAKAKILLGLASMDLNVDRFNAQVGHDQWVVRSKATLKGSMPGIIPTYNDDGIFDGFDWDEQFGISGFGLGFDLGAVYDLKAISQSTGSELLENILGKTKVSMAFTDIGFLTWSGGNSMNLSSPNSEIIVHPKERIISDTLDEYFDDLINDFKEAVNFKQTGSKKGKTARLRTNMNIGVEYEAWANNMTVGVLSSTKFGLSKTFTEVTLSGNYTPEKVDWLAATLSYSFIHNKFNTIGLAVHLAPTKGINFFLASDYLIPRINKEFIPTTSKAVNIQLGFAIPLGETR